MWNGAVTVIGILQQLNIELNNLGQTWRLPPIFRISMLSLTGALRLLAAPYNLVANFRVISLVGAFCR